VSFFGVFFLQDNKSILISILLFAWISLEETALFLFHQ
jgi:hypothetical protein